MELFQILCSKCTSGPLKVNEVAINNTVFTLIESTSNLTDDV